jgi:hypothetical protein
MFGDVGDGNVIWEGVVAHFDFVVGGFDVVGFEGRTSHDAGVGDHSQTPNVDFIGVSDINISYIKA